MENNNRLIIIGRILGVHGIKGELKVQPLTDDPGRFYDLDEVILIHDKTATDYKIKNCRLHKNNVLLFLENVKNRNEAEALIGREVGIPRNWQWHCLKMNFLLKTCWDCRFTMTERYLEK